MVADSTTLDDGYSAGISLSSLDAANLRKAGKWARFVGIVYLVFTGLGILSFIFTGGSTLAMMTANDTIGLGAFIIPFIILYVLILGFTLYLVYLMYKFGSQAVEAVDNGNQPAMTQSFSALGRLYKILGILTVIYLVFMALIFVGAFLGGAAAFLGT